MRHFGNGVMIIKLATFISSAYFYITVLLLLLHLYACIWIGLGIPSSADDETWITRTKNYIYVESDFVNGDFEVYLNALYFTVTTFCTVGYGDVLPKTNSEYIFVMFIQFFGVAQFGIAVSFIISYLSNFKTQKDIDDDELADVHRWVFEYEKTLQKADRPANNVNLRKAYFLMKNAVYQNWNDLFLENEFYQRLLRTEKKPVINEKQR